MVVQVVVRRAEATTLLRRDLEIIQSHEAAEALVPNRVPCLRNAARKDAPQSRPWAPWLH